VKHVLYPIVITHLSVAKLPYNTCYTVITLSTSVWLRQRRFKFFPSIHSSTIAGGKTRGLLGKVVFVYILILTTVQPHTATSAHLYTVPACNDHLNKQK